ncbi:activating signal cointegrator 1 [Phlebotomus argentipes]|uniref:activating signal cointegrator 1 n=1 Tax=Phlebotomus argentipes TaxID=94469 RepID=UPI002892AE5F|nr:activating signal cointegrator 1 [Phlebotomus argentipes]
MNKGLQESLSNILGLEIPEEMVQHILSLRSPEEVDEYFSTLLDYSCEDHLKFVSNFKDQRYKQKSKDGKKKGASGRVTAAPGIQNQKESKVEKPKKKSKFTNLYTAGGNISEIMLKGRHLCNCQASKHSLINNCLNCGRIVCEQEGVGPCLFCGSAVKHMEDVDYGSCEKQETSSKGAKPKVSRDKEDAIAQRNRLLGYDRQSEKRTTVIDDESDYFKANSVWLSDKEREKLKQLEDGLREKKHANRLSHKYKFDFSGRQILDDDENVDYDAFKNMQSIEDSRFHGKTLREINLNSLKIDEAFPELATEPDQTKFVSSRIQDKAMLELSDQGLCLSMHQPWASLLVNGIKKHEGRTWYSSHRGRLWIASTAKPVNPEDVKEVEEFYRRYYNDKNLKFPSQYPSGCLLGHVTMQNCVSQEDYMVEFPGGESESPFVFICSNAVELPVFFPMSGKHKIYKLESKIHVAAVKSLHSHGKL